MDYYVYAHLNPLTLSPFYIGKGKGERISSSIGRNKFWHNTVMKYGYIQVRLVDGLTNEQSLEIEMQYIAKYKLRLDGGCLVNLSMGGQGGNTLNQYNIDAARIKSRNQKIGDKNPNYGKKTWLHGLQMSQETKDKISAAKIGKPLRSEVKVKVLSGLEKAQKVAAKNRTHRVCCLLTGKEWDNRNECMLELKITTPAFKRWVYINRPIKGYHLQLIKK